MNKAAISLERTWRNSGNNSHKICSSSEALYWLNVTSSVPSANLKQSKRGIHRNGNENKRKMRVITHLPSDFLCVKKSWKPGCGWTNPLDGMWSFPDWINGKSTEMTSLWAWSISSIRTQCPAKTALVNTPAFQTKFPGTSEQT